MADGPVFNNWLVFPFLLLAAFILLAGSCQKKTVNGKDKYGLVGDGKSDDTEALQRLLQRGGKITLPKGTYKVSRTLILNPRILEVEAEGVTIIAAPRSTYNLISLQSPNIRFIWQGGTFDGNKDQQIYPGHPNKKYDGKWRQTVTNNGMVGNQNFDAKYVLLENVVLKNFVSDGSCIRADEAIFRNCKAYDSAIPFEKYPQAFKFRSDGIPATQKRVFKINNCYAENTYIGIGVAAKDVGKKTELYIDQFNSKQTTKSSIHLEHIAYAYIKNIKCLASGGDQFSSRIHIGNQNIEFHLEDFELTGGFIRGPKNSQVFKIKNGSIKNSNRFEYAVFHGSKVVDSEVRSINITNCNNGIRAKNIISCEVVNAQGHAFGKADLVDNCRTKKVKASTMKVKQVKNSKFLEVGEQ